MEIPLITVIKILSVVNHRLMYQYNHKCMCRDLLIFLCENHHSLFNHSYRPHTFLNSSNISNLLGILNEAGALEGPGFQGICAICGRNNHMTDFCHYKGSFQSQSSLGFPSGYSSFQWRGGPPWVMNSIMFPQGIPMVSLRIYLWF